MFTCYINDLMVLINDRSNLKPKIEAFAYADDIVVAVQGWVNLHRVIDMV